MANQSEDFDALRKLLALKRHEVPPPGYFDRLPRDIHVRLAAARQPQVVSRERSAPRSNWLSSLLRLAEARPSMVGSFGAAVCGLLLTGIIYSQKHEQPPPTILPELVQTVPLFQGASDPANWAAAPNMLASTNPVMPRPPSSVIFDGLWLNAQPASFPQSPR
jgi:hypothetical protein